MQMIEMKGIKSFSRMDIGDLFGDEPSFSPRPTTIAIRLWLLGWRELFCHGNETGTQAHKKNGRVQGHRRADAGPGVVKDRLVAHVAEDRRPTRGNDDPAQRRHGRRETDHIEHRQDAGCSD